MSEASAETIAILRSIPGGLELLDWLGPGRDGAQSCFHDAEIVEILISQGGTCGLTLLMDRFRKDLAQPRHEQARIQFVLADLVDLHVESILVPNGQGGPNVIGDLRVRLAKPLAAHPASVGLGCGLPDHEINIAPCAGAHGCIRATIARIEMEISASEFPADF